MSRPLEELLAEATPGPWRVSESGLTTNDGQTAVMWYGDAEMAHRVALVDFCREDVKKKDRWNFPDPQRDANAELIALAPKLAEQNRKLLSLLVRAEEQIIWMSGSSDFAPEGTAGNGWVRSRGIIDDIRAAIAEAEAL